MAIQEALCTKDLARIIVINVVEPHEQHFSVISKKEKEWSMKTKVELLQDHHLSCD
jgi:hypothetical protein